jgi:hypothetical protein
MSFWDNVIQPTPGELLPPPENTPYDNVLGTAVGLDPSINDAGAQAVHPSLSPDPSSPDSLIAKAGKPAGFDSPPDQLSPEVFASWHTAYQEEYLNLPQNKAIENTNNGVLTIGTGTDVIHATLSAAQDKVFILETLQKADFATMARADQTRIATADQIIKAADANYNDVLGRLALVADHNLVDGTDANGNKSLYQQTLDKINNGDPDPTTGVPSITDQTVKDIFLKEMTNIEKRIAAAGVYSPPDINAEVQAISDRFHRVAVFKKSLDPNNAEARQAFDDPNQYKNVISLDGGSGISSGISRGYQTFIDSENQILAADNAAMQIASTGTLEGLTKHLDAPNLVAAFQLDANLKDQAINAGDTEEINQINDLLKTYNTIQELINQTIATFDASNSNEKRGLMGYNRNADDANDSEKQFDPNKTPPDVHNTTDDLKNGSGQPPLTDAQMKAISMFEDALNGAPSPIEKLLGVPRPTDFNFYDNIGKTLNTFQKSTWDQWSATLGNTVQQISQQNQITFNNINTLEKERTTHFQSATNALTKALDITSTIGRNIA